MSAPQPRGERSAPGIRIQVRVGSSLRPFLQTPEARMLERALSSDLTLLLTRLGIPGEAQLELQGGRGQRLVRIEVDEKLEAFPPSLMLRSWLAVAPPALHALPLIDDGNASRTFPDGWIGAYLADEEAVDWRLVAAWLERLVYQTILERPSVLLGRDQVAALTRKVPGTAQKEVREVVSAVLDLGASVAERSVIARELAEAREIGRATADTVEACFAELRTHAVGIHVAPATLGRLLDIAPPESPLSAYAAGSPVARQLFLNMEQTFFSNYGFRLPDLFWVPTPTMVDRSVAIRIGEWSGVAVPMPPPGLRLVHESADTLAELGARPAVHPVYGTPCALIEDRLDYKEQLESRGVVTWGPVDFVVLNLYGELTRRPHRVFGVEDLEYELAQLELFGFQPAVQAALAGYPLGDLTRICRALLAEGLSLRDLPGLLERLVEFDVVPVEQVDVDVLDDRLPVPAAQARQALPDAETAYAYLRRRLAAVLSHKAAWYGNTIVAYVLDPKLERRVARWADKPPTEPEAEKFRDDVWREIQSASGLPFGQVIVTSDRARAPVRAVLAPELPGLPVIGRGELAGDTDVRALAVIGPSH